MSYTFIMFLGEVTYTNIIYVHALLAVMVCYYLYKTSTNIIEKYSIIIIYHNAYCGIMV